MEGPVGEAVPEWKSDWVLWEIVKKLNPKTKSNFSDLNKEVITFDSMESFAMAFHHTPYSLPSNFLTMQKNDPQKNFSVNGETRSLEGLLFFRKGIAPKWEDPAHITGSSLHCDFKLTSEPLDKLWREVIFRLVADEQPHAEHITGIRLLNRYTADGNVRLEFWLRVTKKLQGDAEERAKKGKVIDEITANIVEILQNIVSISPSQVIWRDFATVSSASK